MIVIAATAAVGGCAHTTHDAPRAATVERVAASGATRIVVAPDPAPDVTSDAEEADGFDSDAIRRCTPETPEHDGAKQALWALGRKIDALPKGASAKALQAELAALLETKCFELAAADLVEEELVFDSGLSLKTWWDEGEGARWLDGYLTKHHGTTLVTIPGSPRHTLFLEANQKHALAPLLCPASEVGSAPGVGCGRETVGWTRRAEADLLRRAPARTEEDCVASAKASPPVERYATFLQCRAAGTPVRDGLPLGRFKSPSEGLLVIEGRTPNGQSCEELRVYDLSSGAAFVIEGCAQVNAPPATVTAGRVPLGALREAMWMLAFAGAKESDVRAPDSSVVVPEWISIGRVRGLRGASLGFGYCWSSSRAVRSWSWMRMKNGVYTGQISGELDWPGVNSHAEDHAGELLSIAEDAFAAGCAPSPLPRAPIAWDAPGASLTEGLTVDLQRPETAFLRQALAAARPVPRCAPAP